MTAGCHSTEDEALRNRFGRREQNEGNEMIKHQSPMNEPTTSSQAPVQVINVPFNSLRAEPNFRSHQAYDKFDAEGHAVSRLEALSLKDGGGGPQKLTACGGKTSAILSTRSQQTSPHVATASTQSPAPTRQFPPSIQQFPVSSNSDTKSLNSAVARTNNNMSCSTAAGGSAPSSLQPPASSRGTAGVASSGESVASTNSTIRSQREQFLVFIKILFKCLDQANEPEVRNKAKRIVAECTRRNRLGDPGYAPLMAAVEKRLRTFVGEALWRRSLLLLRHYMAKKGGDAASKSGSDSVTSGPPGR